MSRSITLRMADNDDELYIVERLVGLIEPRVGVVLKEREVVALLSRRHATITIHRAKS